MKVYPKKEWNTVLNTFITLHNEGNTDTGMQMGWAKINCKMKLGEKGFNEIWTKYLELR